MANIGLIDVDGHNFPNLALMRISAYHKAQGDTVGWWWGWEHYDRVYMSKVFSNDYTPDVDEPVNAEEIVKGGTGYAIKLVNGAEVYNKGNDPCLPREVEEMAPDYTIYPQYDFAVSMTSRGCPRGCGFCHVASKEGKRSVKVADVGMFWRGQNVIQVLDPNITACKDKRELFRQYAATGARIVFSQGLDIRLLNDDDIADINGMRLKEVHFAWDNPEDDLEAHFRRYAEKTTHKPGGYLGRVYVLTNYGDYTEDEHVRRALHRIYTLRRMGYLPYLMIYDKNHAPRQIRRMQRWCNNVWIQKTCSRFEDYNG